MTGRRTVESERRWGAAWWWHAGWPAGPGDPAGGGDGEHPVAGHAVGPAGGVGFQAVVPPAQTTQIGAVGVPALGVRDHVIQVGPPGPVRAVGLLAVPVAGLDEPPLPRGGLVPVGAARRAQPAAVPDGGFQFPAG